MSILISGDFHANAVNELKSITAKTLRKQFGGEYAGITHHIIAGDCGFLWPGNEKQDRFNLSLLSRRLWPILCLFGNHDNYDAITSCEKVDIGIGNEVYKVLENVYYLPRGFIYTIDGLSILCLGGALSVDKAYRTEHKSWWKDEYWSEAEEEACFRRVTGKPIDYVVSHTGPHGVIGAMFGAGIDAQKYTDLVAKFHNRLRKSLRFDHWFFGHFHRDVFGHKDQGRLYSALYRKTAVVSKGRVIYSDGSVSP
ncbi:MAG: metallophosphoesterase [Spirochaetaceae bacterium]|jgi:DNA repair exonuclease SbcCD nuclease subunit|nr:metallophosphoesterase [Spirochaetaceae bacterium]